MSEAQESGNVARPRVVSMRAWFLLAVVAVVLGAGLAFLAIGSAHRDSCALTTSDLSGCNLLPWSGHGTGGFGP